MTRRDRRKVLRKAIQASDFQGFLNILFGSGTSKGSKDATFVKDVKFNKNPGGFMSRKK